MNARKRELTVIETTPAQLRQIADALDRKWAKVKLGDEVPSETVLSAGDPVVEVRFVIDQEEKYREEAAAEGRCPRRST